jgi:NhaP-type Na+/H+ or K+/H+ antiporter
MLGAAPGLHFGEPYMIGLVVAGLAVLAAVGALSQQHDRAFSASVIYLGIGCAAAFGIELIGVDWVDPLEDDRLVERLSELSLVIALFATGLRLDRPLQAVQWHSVGRLLLIAMPLTIAAITAFGTGVMGLSLGAAIVLGAILAPTDPVLAGDVGVGPPGDEEEREPNFSITGEAGLNDGLAYPFVLLGLLVAGGVTGGDLARWALEDVVFKVAVGLAVGATLGYALAAASVRLRDRGLLAPELDGWMAVAAAPLLYGATELLSGYGFLAAFAGGLAFRRYERDHEYNRGVHHGAETAEKFGELALVLLVGSSLTISGLGEPGFAGWLLAPVLLLLIRPASVVLSMLGSGTSRAERAFMGWFGVRGISSIYYAAVALQAGLLNDGEALKVVWTAVVVVVVSIFVHGISAAPLSRRWLRT